MNGKLGAFRGDDPTSPAPVARLGVPVGAKKPQRLASDVRDEIVTAKSDAKLLLAR